jgi:hypothetical protein
MVVAETSFAAPFTVFHVILIAPVTGVVELRRTLFETAAVVLRVPVTVPDSSSTLELSVSTQPRSVPRIVNLVIAEEFDVNGGEIWIPPIIDEQ